MRGAGLGGRIAAMMPRAREELAELVAFRSVAAPAGDEPEQCRGAARWVARAFAGAGVADARTVDMPDGSVAVIGHAPGPPGAPTVLLYSHHDVQPPGDLAQWSADPWTLTERGGRWYGRGAADCKGNVLAHLLALRALGARLPVGVTVVCEGSEEQATGGLEAFVAAEPDVLRADAIVVLDSGNVALGEPTLTTSLRGMTSVTVTVRALERAVHSGILGGAAPDPVAALVRMLASLHDDRGNVAVRGLPAGQLWGGAAYPVERFRADAGVLDGVGLLGDGAVADMLWARPAVTVLGIDVPAVAGAVNAVQPSARAKVSLRVPPGMDAAEAREALARHLVDAVPWGLRVELEPGDLGAPWAASPGGPAHAAMSAALAAAYGRAPVSMGSGGSIPLCTALQDAYPAAEILLLGVEEPLCRIHAADESVHPAEIERIALAEALFLSALGRPG